MRSLLVRFAFVSLPLAALIACEDSSSSSGGGSFTPEAGTTFTAPDASSGTDSSPPAPPKPAETTTTLDLTPLSPKVGEELTIKVTVSGKTPTGTVQLKDGANNLGAPIALAGAAGAPSATASFKTKTLTPGAHALSAVYAGDDDDATSTSTVTSFDLKYGTTNPFATGLDNASVVLADLAVDPHWTIKNGAGKAFTAYVQTDAKGYIGYWLAPSATSKFLSPFMDTDDTLVEGPFTYTTTFTLRTGVDLAGTSLSVSYANDNAMDSISLNGTAVPGVTAGGYGSFTVLPITGPFNVGTNTISFVSSNSGGPTGFRAELVLTAN
jgi:hypothetical protein